MKGKSKCRILKEIRRKIAAENGIEFVTSECKYQGDCSGTCPKCEAEVRYLETELNKRKNAGKAIAVAGIAATMLTACATPAAEPTASSGNITVPSSQTTTPETSAPETSAPETSASESYITMGDIVMPPETTETLPVPGEVIWETEPVDGELVLQGDVPMPSEEETLPAGMIPPPPETEDDVLMGEPPLPPETELPELMGEPPVEYNP